MLYTHKHTPNALIHRCECVNVVNLVEASICTFACIPVVSEAAVKKKMGSMWADWGGGWVEAGSGAVGRWCRDRKSG